MQHFGKRRIMRGQTGRNPIFPHATEPKEKLVNVLSVRGWPNLTTLVYTIPTRSPHPCIICKGLPSGKAGEV